MTRLPALTRALQPPPFVPGPPTSGPCLLVRFQGGARSGRHTVRSIGSTHQICPPHLALNQTCPFLPAPGSSQTGLHPGFLSRPPWLHPEGSSHSTPLERNSSAPPQLPTPSTLFSSQQQDHPRPYLNQQPGNQPRAELGELWEAPGSPGELGRRIPGPAPGVPVGWGWGSPMLCISNLLPGVPVLLVVHGSHFE